MSGMVAGTRRHRTPASGAEASPRATKKRADRAQKLRATRSSAPGPGYACAQPPRSSPPVGSRGGPVERSRLVVMVNAVGEPSTTVRSRMGFPQSGHCQPSTPKTRFNNSAHPSGASSGSLSRPRLASRLTRRSDARASRSASVELGTFGTTSFRQAALPARTPAYSSWFDRNGGTIAVSFSVSSKQESSIAEVPSLQTLFIPTRTRPSGSRSIRAAASGGRRM